MASTVDAMLRGVVVVQSRRCVDLPRSQAARAIHCPFSAVRLSTFDNKPLVLIYPTTPDGQYHVPGYCWPYGARIFLLQIPPAWLAVWALNRIDTLLGFYRRYLELRARCGLEGSVVHATHEKKADDYTC